MNFFQGPSGINESPTPFFLCNEIENYLQFKRPSVSINLNTRNDNCTFLFPNSSFFAMAETTGP